MGPALLLAAVLTAATLNSAVSETVDSVDVSIEVSYSAPEDFSLQAPYYRAASALTLSCVVAEDNGGLFYQWTSTCQGSCFVQGASSQRVSTHALHSRDSGVHTCTVYDGLGCTGNASITVHVSGVGIHVLHNHEILSNNDIITAHADGRLSHFYCISATQRFSVGNLIGPTGVDVTRSTTDPFLVTRSGSSDPGVLQVRSHGVTNDDDEGVYTCRIPNEFNTMTNVNVGIYGHNYNGTPEVISLVHNVTSLPYTITCTSTVSPPTSVIWERNGAVMVEDSIHKFSKILVDRQTSTYRNMLTIEESFALTVADYSCTVSNSFGESNTLETSIKELEVTGHEAPLIVGLSGELTCSTHLDVAKLEWYLVGFEDSLEETANTTLSIDVDVYGIALDGNEFTCRGTTTDGGIHEKTIAIVVKELEHVVEIEAPPNPVQPGREVQLTCVVTSDIAPQVSWVVTTDNVTDLGDVFIGEPVVEGNTTTLVLSIGTLKTSHGRQYSCLSFVQNPASFKTETWNVIVQIPTPEVSLNQTPANAVLYTTSDVLLTCAVQVDETVDTAVNISISWIGPSGALSNGSRYSAFDSSVSSHEYLSEVNISSLLSSDSGSYTCAVDVVPSLSSTFVAASNTFNSSTSLQAVLRVKVEVSYTAPDQYPTYQPPEYRTASAVSLRCVAHGTSGYVSYRWSSTCSSPCFAYSSSSQTISDSFLRWYDAGVHTCTASDALGNSGSNSTEMKIVGAGIYLVFNYWHTGLRSAQPIANNSMLMVDTGGSSYGSYTRLNLFCCSNSSASNIGSFVFPSGSVYTSNTGSYVIDRQSGWSSTYAGCIQFYIQYYPYNHYYLPNTGVYTCRIPDASGNTLDVDFGLYPQGYSNAPQSATLRHETSTATFTLSCRSRSYPATWVTFSRNGAPVDIDQETTQVHSMVTSRSSAYYTTTFVSSEDPDDLVGTYTCTAGNQFGSVTSTELETEGIELSYTEVLTVNTSEVLTCSSDLHIQRIEWFANGSRVAASSSSELAYTLDPVSTDHHGSLYTCVATSPYGNQERNITLNVTVPDNWALVEIVNSTGENPINDTHYTLTCTVHGISGMHLPAVIEWVDRDGSVMTSSQRITVGEEVSVGTDTTLSLTFDPVYNRDAGVYSCRASVDVPWMAQQPPVHSANVDMQVTTQAIFQLKMWPIPNCLNWESDISNDLKYSIRSAIEEEVRQRCNCSYRSYGSIYDDGFLCQSTLTSMVYRARVNGTSSLLTANQILNHITDWRDNEGIFKNDDFYVRLTQNEACPLQVSSFNEQDCDTTGNASGMQPV